MDDIILTNVVFNMLFLSDNISPRGFYFSPRLSFNQRIDRTGFAGQRHGILVNDNSKNHDESIMGARLKEPNATTILLSSPLATILTSRIPRFGTLNYMHFMF